MVCITIIKEVWTQCRMEQLQKQSKRGQRGCRGYCTRQNPVKHTCFALFSSTVVNLSTAIFFLEYMMMVPSALIKIFWTQFKMAQLCGKEQRSCGGYCTRQNLVKTRVCALFSAQFIKNFLTQFKIAQLQKQRERGSRGQRSWGRYCTGQNLVKTQLCALFSS